MAQNGLDNPETEDNNRMEKLNERESKVRRKEKTTTLFIMNSFLT